MLDNVKDCCLSFEEFQRASCILCVELNPTMCKVLVTFEKIKKILNNPNFSSVIQMMVSIMKVEICKRIRDEEIPLMAAMLSPDTKNLIFVSEASTSSSKSFGCFKLKS